MAVTLKELAGRLGVSVSTVSRALNRPDMVGSDTRARVVSLADELGYVPNHAARTLITGRTATWGIVVPDLENPFFPGIVKGAQAAARAGGCSLLIVDTNENPDDELALVEHLTRQSDAVVLCSSRMTRVQLLDALSLGPVVLVNRVEQGLPHVTFDTRQGVREAASHLRALGHRRVGYAGGPAHSYSDRERAALVGAEFSAQGLDIVDLGRFEPSIEGGQAAADGVLLSDVTAIMAYDDIMAMGLISRLKAYGVEVPRDLTVIGWDDVEFAELFTPALTTIHVPRREAGTAAIRLLERILAGEDPVSANLATRLVYRATSGPAPASPSGLRVSPLEKAS